eukprot:1143617-Pelagomonas_calceolata.AAC.11
MKKKENSGEGLRTGIGGRGEVGVPSPFRNFCSSSKMTSNVGLRAVHKRVLKERKKAKRRKNNRGSGTLPTSTKEQGLMRVLSLCTHVGVGGMGSSCAGGASKLRCQGRQRGPSFLLPHLIKPHLIKPN